MPSGLSDGSFMDLASGGTPDQLPGGTEGRRRRGISQFVCGIETGSL